MLSTFGHRVPGEITQVDLERWWTETIDGEGPSLQTGKHYLNSPAQVLLFARKQGLCKELGTGPGLRAMGLEVIERDQARPRRWELRRIPPQKIDITDKTDISDDPDDNVDLLQPCSQFVESATD